MTLFHYVSGQTLVRFGVENIILTFQKHDKNTCLDRCGMRLRKFTDFFKLAIFILHFCQYIYSQLKMLPSNARILKYYLK